jgi:hypothetical protein
MSLSQSQPERGDVLSRALAMSADEGSPDQLEAALAMVSGDDSLASRIRAGSRLPSAPILDLMGIA